MAGLIALSIGLGAEKLGRTISEKRLERKEKKAVAQHEAMYGSSSSGPTPPMTTRERQSKTDRKREDAQHQPKETWKGQPAVASYERRRSTSAERVRREELPPPSYDDVVRQDERRA